MHECYEDWIRVEMNYDDDSRRQLLAERRQLLGTTENIVELNLGETKTSENSENDQNQNLNSDKRNQNGRTLTEVFFTHLDIEDNLELLPNGASPGPMLKTEQLELTRSIIQRRNL